MRTVLVVLVVVVVAVLAYNYQAGQGLTLQAPSSSSGIDVKEVREKGTAMAEKAAANASALAEDTKEAVNEATLTAKIKSKMALDDLVRAARINVDTNGSVVTLTGDVRSGQERERALLLARETVGVTAVIDRLHVGN